VKILMLIDNEYGVGTFWRGYHIAKNLAKYHKVDPAIVHLSRRRVDKIFVGSEHGITLISTPRTGFLSILTYSLISLFKEYDLLHVFATAKASTGIATILTKFSSRKKVVVDWDDWWTRGGLFSYSILIDKTHRFLEETGPKLADAVIVVSDLLYMRARSLDIPSNKIFKVINGADTSLNIYSRDIALRKLNLPGGYFYILYTGLSIHSREFLTFLNAFKLLINRYKDARLILLGRIPIVYLAYIRKLGIEHNVIISGYVPFDRYIFYLSIADAFILPADPIITEAARFPIRLGDYLVAGKPILVSDVGEMGKFVKQCECGITIRPASPESWLDGLIRLLEDDGSRLKMGDKARHCADKFSWKYIAQQVYHIYRKALYN
jgi:glycosyltransferase involved in cell wall biosynthesis